MRVCQPVPTTLAASQLAARTAPLPASAETKRKITPNVFNVDFIFGLLKMGSRQTMSTGRIETMQTGTERPFSRVYRQYQTERRRRTIRPTMPRPASIMA